MSPQSSATSRLFRGERKGERDLDFRPVIFIIGIFLVVLAGSMLVPAAADALTGNPDWKVFVAATTFTLFVGLALVFSTRGSGTFLSKRQAFILVTLIWIALPLFGALPFIFSELELSFTDAFFEAMSGITTTGSTVITGLDGLPPGILLWRAILQWLGGLGIIVMAIGIFPLLRIGGMHLFHVEAFDTHDKGVPRAAQISVSITMVYLGLTALCALALWVAGMTGFEAIAHSMTTIATAGYSTSDGSIGHFASPLIEAIITVGMFVGGIPFILYVKCLRGDPRELLGDQQVHWYLAILAGSILAIAIWLVQVHEMHPLQALRYASFSATSVMTGTGYASIDYSFWGGFPVIVLFALMFVGGCAGSTSCSIKVFRFVVVYEASIAQIRRLIYPNGVFTPRYNGRPVDPEVLTSVMSFFFLFAASFVVLALALAATGLDFMTASSGAATALANVGPGFGPLIGPTGSFQDLSNTAKWLLSAGMLVGRLEIFTVLVLLTARFWRG